MNMEKNKSILQDFFEQLSPEEQLLIKDYLQEKSLEFLSKAFDNIIKNNTNVD